jgi:cell division septum initiation protein DivIVA
MGQDKKTPVIIDDVEYIYEEMTDEQKTLTNHVADLDRKISSAKFNLDQLSVGKDAFIKMLKEALTKAQEVQDVEPVVINS